MHRYILFSVSTIWLFQTISFILGNLGPHFFLGLRLRLDRLVYKYGCLWGAVQTIHKSPKTIIFVFQLILNLKQIAIHMAANVQTSSLLFLVFLLLQNFYSASKLIYLVIQCCSSPIFLVWVFCLFFWVMLFYKQMIWKREKYIKRDEKKRNAIIIIAFSLPYHLLYTIMYNDVQIALLSFLFSL